MDVSTKEESTYNNLSTVFTTFGQGLLLQERDDGVCVVKMDWGTIYVTQESILGRLDESDVEFSSSSDEEEEIEGEDNLGTIAFTGDHKLDKAALDDLYRSMDDPSTSVPLMTKNEINPDKLPIKEVARIAMIACKICQVDFVSLCLPKMNSVCQAPALSEDAVLQPFGSIQSIIQSVIVIEATLEKPLDIDSPFYLEDRTPLGVVEDVFGTVPADACTRFRAVLEERGQDVAPNRH